MSEDSPRGIEGLLSRKRTPKYQQTPEIRPQHKEQTVDDTLAKAIQKANKDPRITYVGREEVAVLHYLAATVPQFKPSTVSTKIIRKALMTMYPGEWEAVTRAIESMK